MKSFIIFSLIIFTHNLFAYECKDKELIVSKLENRKEAFLNLQKMDRQVLVEGLLFELTTKDFTKKRLKKTEILLSFLESTEAIANQRAFFKLLKTSSELEGGISKVKSLNLKEVCEILDKVNKLD